MGRNASRRPAGREMLPPRHELKYYINATDHVALRLVLASGLQRDPNGDAHNNYSIRSLYFDDVYNRAMVDKLSGVEHRDKYRIRIYNYSDKEIFLERKRKLGDLIQKSSVQITRRLCDQLASGDCTGLYAAENPLLKDVYCQMRTKLLRPVVLVDYVREAYCYPVENVRITFDKQLRSGLSGTNLFAPTTLAVSPFKGDKQIVLEVKYNRFLPEHIRYLMGTIPGNRSAISKYVLCRRFDPTV